MNWPILLTRLLALGLYAGTFFYAASALRLPIGHWPRKMSLWIITILSGYWALSYIWIIVDTWDNLVWPTLGFIAMLTRVGHYATAIGMYVLVAFIRAVTKQYDMAKIDE